MAGLFLAGEREMDGESKRSKGLGSHPPLQKGSIKPALTRHEWILSVSMPTPAGLGRGRGRFGFLVFGGASTFLSDVQLEQPDGDGAGRNFLGMLSQLPAALGDPVEKEVAGLSAGFSQEDRAGGV